MFLKVLDRRNTGEPMMSCEEPLVSIGPESTTAQNIKLYTYISFYAWENGWGLPLNKEIWI